MPAFIVKNVCRGAKRSIRAIVLQLACVPILLGVLCNNAARANGRCLPTDRVIRRSVLRLPPVCVDQPATPVFSSQELCLDSPPCFQRCSGDVAPGPQLCRWLKKGSRNIRSDHALYYSQRTLLNLTLGIAMAAPLANTSLDHGFRNWWQEDVRSSETDDFAAFWKPFGEGAIFIPAMACLGLAGQALSSQPAFDVGGEFGYRATRAYLVGAPPVLLMQAMLGGSRPGETGVDSQWKPFDDNNAVSGHSFVGAVPFITAAQMTESRALRTLFYLGSACPAWSRVNDDAHYLSQAFLGWYMAYLACQCVEGTESQQEPLSIVPLACPEYSGIGLMWQR